MNKSGRVSDNNRSGSACSCDHERIHRECAGQSSPQPFDAVIKPPNLYSESTENQDSDSMPGSQDSPVPLEARLHVAERQVAQLLREKKDAFRQLKEVTKMNTRWQKYDKEREDVVADLTTRHHRDAERIRQLETKCAEHRSRNEDLELRWTDARVRASERKSELERVKRENEHLQTSLVQSEKKREEMGRKLEVALKEGAGARRREDERKERVETDKDRDLYHMSKRVVDLKEKVARLEGQVDTYKKQMEEESNLYTQQITICLDDFKQEKKDKERMKKENDDLKKQLKKAEDFASSLKVQITRYQQQQRVTPVRIQPSASHHVHKYYGNIYEEQLSDSWDDAGYALPSDVVRDNPIGFDESDNHDNGGVARPGNHTFLGAVAAVDPPPQYDDRSVMGQVVAFPPKSTGDGRAAPPQIIPKDNLVLH